MRRVFLILLLTLAGGVQAQGWVGDDLEGRPCAGLEQGFGPFDYTNPKHKRKYLGKVESHHFTAAVEALKHGESSRVITDLDYTLRAFPNHHRALFSVIRYYADRYRGRKHSQLPDRVTRGLPPPECYLQRALDFRPKDGNVHALFGIYLYKLGDYDQAREHYEKAAQLNPRSAEIHYNLGLLYVKLKEWEKARAAARKAYRLGYPLRGLQRKLAAAGHSLD